MDYTHFRRHRRKRHVADTEADIKLPPANRNLLDWELSPHGVEPHVAKEPIVERLVEKAPKK